MFKEFKDFALRGRVIDMAVGIIIGGAFGAFVTSLVNDVLMPPIGVLVGGVDFSDLFFVLKQGTTPGPYLGLSEAQAAGAVSINYGIFLNNLTSFLIVAFAVFLLIRGINALQRQEDIASPEPTEKACPFCFSKVAIKATRCAHCTSELSVA